MIKIKRTNYCEYGTFGTLSVNDVPLMITLERLPMFNQKNISCIPTGIYECEKYNSPKRGECILIKNVPDRSGILIHSGNTIEDTEGCVLVGLEYGKVNNTRGILRSREALKKLLNTVPQKFMLEIEERK